MNRNINKKRITKMIRFLLAGASFLTIGCAPIITQPTPEQKAQADYGQKPTQSELPGMIRKYLKSQEYYDPNGAEIENCTDLVQGWIDNFNYTDSTPFIFVWTVKCDVNGKNRMGGFTGFQTLEYHLKDGAVIEGDILEQRDAPMIWK